VCELIEFQVFYPLGSGGRQRPLRCSRMGTACALLIDSWWQKWVVRLYLPDMCMYTHRNDPICCDSCFIDSIVGNCTKSYCTGQVHDYPKPDWYFSKGTPSHLEKCFNLILNFLSRWSLHCLNLENITSICLINLLIIWQ